MTQAVAHIDAMSFDAVGPSAAPKLLHQSITAKKKLRYSCRQERLDLLKSRKAMSPIAVNFGNF
jgi:hypothetical protein